MVDLRLDAVPVVSYAMAYNRVPVVAGVDIEVGPSPAEPCEAELSLVVADDEGRLSQPWQRAVTLPAEGTVRLRAVDLRLDFTQVGQLVERRPARYECRLTDAHGGLLASLDVPVTVLAPHQWQGAPPGLAVEMLAAHVMPNAPEVARLVADASQLLGRATGSPAVEGYQSGPERVDHIVRALYESVRQRRVAYAEPPPSWVDDGQKVRTPAEVLEGGQPGGPGGGLATCLDLAVVLAAAMEHAGIRPLVVLTEGHACCAYWRHEAASATAAHHDLAWLANLVDLHQVGLVEATGACAGVDLPWEVAATRPYEQLLRPPHHLVGVLDVFTARQNRIVPLPARSRTEQGEPLVVEYRPEAHSVAPAEREEVARPAAATADAEPMPPRFQQWQNALIDLSLRNPLLNLTRRTGVAVAAPGPVVDLLENRLAAGRRLVLWPYDDLGAVHDARTGLRSFADIDLDLVRARFDRGSTVVVDVTTASYATTFRNLAYRARTVIEEMGANALHLTLGELVWRHDGRELRSPLVLVPVHLRLAAGRQRYEVVADDTGAPTPNYCLREKLRQTHGLDLRVLDDPPTDTHGLDVPGLFQAVREAVAAAGLPFRVEPAARLAVLQFAKFRLWRDIADHWQTMLRQPLVRHLALTPTHEFRDPAAARPAEPVDLDELGARCPIPADASQVGAIAEALQGRTFVLEGPPGTGKSQTITNLLARAVADGKRVLFVAEKQAALEVVKRRLDDVGLASISLDLHDRSAKPREIRRQVQRALDLVADSDLADLARRRAEQTARRRPLARYVDALHGVNGAGLSLYGAVAARRAVDVDPLPVPPEAVGPAAADALARARDAVRLVPDAADPVGAAPSPWGFATTPPPGVEPAAVYAAAAAWEQASHPGALGRLGPWGRVLDECRTPGEAAAVADLLTLGDVRIGSVDLAASPSWSQLLVQAERELGEVAAAGLGPLRPEALDLDVDALLADARAAAASFFLLRGRRLTTVGRRLGDVATVPVERAQVVPVVEALAAARDRGRGLAASITDRMPNLRLPAGWHPCRPDAVATLRAAAHTVRRAARAADPQATRPGLAAAVRAALPVEGDLPPGVRDAVRQVVAAFRTLTGLLGATDAATLAWCGPAGFAARWRDTAARRVLGDAGHASLRAWLGLTRQVEPLRAAGLGQAAEALLTGACDPDLAPVALEAGLVDASVTERVASGQLGAFDAAAHRRAIDRYQATAAELRVAEREGLLGTALDRRTFAATAEVGRVGALRREVGRQRGGMSVRELLAGYADLIAEILPCALVSPDSVARYYPLQPDLFDLVVFDEASQIKVADAIGAIARATAVVVVGDSKQMPPTSFAEVSAADDEATTSLTVADEESILSECVQAGLPRHWLSWHYRSQDESLIAFSNAHYYEGRLSSFPAPVRGPADPGVGGHGVSLVRVDGTFLRDGAGRALRTNPVEAEAIVAAIVDRFDAVPDGTMPSIGVVTFNAQQRALIESLLRDRGDPRLVAALESGHEGLFVKNLENVQGDERDTVMFSTAFSVNERGVLPLNFGPLNLSGGERRLNVAITRARRQVLVFSSFDPSQLRAEQTSSVGVKHLKAYLELAAAGSPLSALATTRRSVRDRHRDDVAERLRRAGVAVTTDVGLSEFRVDLCLARADAPDQPLVAVLLDSVEWGRRRTVADRYELPEVVLAGLLRWPAVEWVWLPDWLTRPDEVVARLVAAVAAAHPPGTAPVWEPLPVASPDDPGDEPGWYEPPPPDGGDRDPAHPGDPEPVGANPGGPGPMDPRPMDPGQAGPRQEGPQQAVLQPGPAQMGPGPGQRTGQAGPGQGHDPLAAPSPRAHPAGVAGDGLGGPVGLGAAGPRVGGAQVLGSQATGAVGTAAGSGFVGADALGPAGPVGSRSDGAGATAAGPAGRDPLLPGESWFVAWQPRDAGQRTVLDQLPRPWAVQQVAEVAAEVVAAEGPVHRDRLVGLVARAFDLTRVSRSRHDAIVAAIGARDEFVWPAGLDPRTWRGFRRTPDLAARPLAVVAPEEVVNAVCAIVLATRGVSRDELVRATMAEFGVSRRGAKAAGRIERAVAEAVAAGRVVERDGLFVVP